MATDIKHSPPVVFLMGATATGKTDLAARVVDEFALEFALEFELVSVDAAQVYRGMDIGTAKPSADFLRAYPHHLINIREPSAPYSAAAFCADARELIGEIHARGKVPLLTGGTMFYFAALENGLSDLPEADADTRARLNAEIEAAGLTVMHAKLNEIDPTLGKKIRSTDRQRIQRALEIYHLTEQPPSEVMAQGKPTPLGLPLIKLGLYFQERAELHARIEKRFMQMLACGLEDEVAQLAASLQHLPAYQNLPAMRTVGYRQVLGFLREEYAREEMIARAVAATRQLAKRQLTWMRGWDELVWVESGDGAAGEVCDYLREHLRAHLNN